MPDSTTNFNILEIARDFLFVEDTDFYPDQIWEDFAEALYLFLTDDEIEVLNYRYGDYEFCDFSIDKRRRILSDLMLRFNRSEFYSEMDAVMKSYESATFSSSYQDEAEGEAPRSDDFVRNSLLKLGLEYRPGSVGECNFDAQIGNFPVYVWRFRELAMPLRILMGLLNVAASAGFGRFFLVAHPRLTVDLPLSAEGCIPYTFIPLVDEPFSSNGFDAKRTTSDYVT